MRLFDGEDSCFKELLVCVFFVNIKLLETRLGQFLEDEVVSRHELFFSKVSIVFERVILSKDYQYIALFRS
jgi:hypothetical protein